MQEDFLHFVWMFQHFAKEQLTTTENKSLQILQTGKSHRNAGADFIESKIVIDDVIWAGNVEIHLKSSDWEKHQHTTDEAYQTVILHVVWKHDKVIYRKDNTPVPTLELEGKVNPELLKKYKSLLAAHTEIPCQSEWKNVKDIYKIQMLDNVLMQRLEQKADFIRELLTDNKNDWEETAYQTLAKNFGFKINSEPFLKLAQRLPLKVIHKHADNLMQIEALLMGQAGLLNDAEEDDYVKLLKREYSFLSHKYDLQSKQMKGIEWKMLRLRPANFPTLRLAQFAAFLQKNATIFSLLLDFKNPQELKNAFDFQTSAYWQNHYVFGRKTEKPVPDFGKTSLENILINSVVPLLVAYAHVKDNKSYIEKAVSILESLPAEDNKITRTWEEIGLKVKNAFDSQAAIELYNHFCTPKKCLSCKIGTVLLNRPLHDDNK
jgi:hypothetical protein